MRKVLIHNIAGGYGGSERTMELLIPLLEKQADVFVFGENERFLRNAESLLSNSSRVINSNHGRSIFSLFAALIKTVSLCWQEQFTTAIINTNKSALIFAICRFFIPRKTRLLVFIRDFQWIHAKLIFSSLDSKAEYFAPSAAVSQYWPKNYGRKKEPASPPGGGISSKHALTIIPDCYSQVKTNPKSESSATLLALGTINPWKGIDTIISSLPLIQAKIPTICLRIVGGSPDPEFLKRIVSLTEKMNLQNRVLFLPPVDDISSELNNCDCVISASVPWNGGPETFGRTVIEAWAHQKPVVASRCGGPVFLIRDYHNGILFDPGNPVDLAKAVVKLFSDADLLSRIKFNGHSEYQEKYTTESVARQLISCIER